MHTGASIVPTVDAESEGYYWLLVTMVMFCAHQQSQQRKSREIRARSKCVEIWWFLRCYEVIYFLVLVLAPTTW